VFSELKLISRLSFSHRFACKVPRKGGIYHLDINFDSSQPGRIKDGRGNPFERFRNPIGAEGTMAERIYCLKRISIPILRSTRLEEFDRIQIIL
jgi:hypothetical protein